MSQASLEIMKTAQQALETFSHGLATGEWNFFLDMLSDDFSFWFPVGPFQGWNYGKLRASDFFHSVSQVFSEGLVISVERCSSNANTVVFEIRSTGTMAGNPYQNQAAISFDIRGNQVCGYREYLGVLFQLPSS